MSVADPGRGWQRLAEVSLALLGLLAAPACSSHASTLRDRAASEDARLLALVPTVRSATAVSRAPTRAMREAPSRASLIGLVTKARYWTVKRDAGSVYEELTHTTPFGLEIDGRGSSSGPTLADENQYATDRPRSLPDGIAYAQLILAVAPTGENASAIGAYAQAVAQPGRPDAEVVPSGAGATVTASYGGTITRSQALSGPVAAQLVRDFNLLTVSTVGETSCPSSDGSTVGATMRVEGHVWRTAGSCGNEFESVTRDGKDLATLTSNSDFLRDLNRALDVPPSVRVVRRLTGIARALAQRNGRAVSAQAVWAPHHSAASRYLSEAIVHDSQPVWAIELQGRFICSGCSIPPGAKTPRGTVLIEVVDARTFRDEDFSLTRRYLPLSALGPTFQLQI